MIVAFLTRFSNIVVTEDTEFPYDHAVVLDTDFFTWAGEGNPLVCQVDGWYGIQVNSTTLGTGYGTTGLGSGTAAPNNSDWLHAVGKNGITLADTVISERHVGLSGASAQLMSTGPCPVYLEAGDTIDVYYQNLAGSSSLLVESNPSDGPNYHTDTGPGTLSPHLIITTITGSVPDWTP